MADKIEDSWSVNIYIIQNFINFAENLNPSPIIFLSSAWALYPKNIQSYKFTENDLPITYS